MNQSTGVGIKLATSSDLRHLVRKPDTPNIHNYGALGNAIRQKTTALITISAVHANDAMMPGIG